MPPLQLATAIKSSCWAKANSENGCGGESGNIEKLPLSFSSVHNSRSDQFPSAIVPSCVRVPTGSGG